MRFRVRFFEDIHLGLWQVAEVVSHTLCKGNMPFNLRVCNQYNKENILLF